MSADRTYRLGRDGQHHGPYTLEQLQQRARDGSTQPGDLVWSPGMPNWVPLEDVIGDIGRPGMPPPLPPTGGTDAPVKPPSLHWAIVLLLGIVTFGLFLSIWLLVQAWWVKRMDPKSKAFYVLVTGLCIVVAASIAHAALLEGSFGGTALEMTANLTYIAMYLIATFDMRAVVDVRYGTSLSGLLTFFLGPLYLQYHFRRIATGEHKPETHRLLT